MHSASWLLAFQSSADKSSRLFADVLPWLIVLIGVALVGGVVIYLVRRSLRNEAARGSEGFTLQNLRDLHAAGELSDEEFDRAKAQMIGRLNALRSTSRFAEKLGDRDEKHAESSRRLEAENPPSPGNSEA